MLNAFRRAMSSTARPNQSLIGTKFPQITLFSPMSCMRYDFYNWFAFREQNTPKFVRRKTALVVHQGSVFNPRINQYINNSEVFTQNGYRILFLLANKTPLELEALQKDAPQVDFVSMTDDAKEELRRLQCSVRSTFLLTEDHIIEQAVFPAESDNQELLAAAELNSVLSLVVKNRREFRVGNSVLKF